MAHTVFLTRGELHFVERFIKELSTRYLPFNKFNDKRELERGLLQLRVCPIQLWDISYPIEHRDVVHNTLFGTGKGDPIHARNKKFVFPLRKILKLNKLEEYNTTKGKLAMMPPEHIEMIAVGVKDDYWIEPDGSHVKTKDKTENAMEGI